MTPPLTIEFRIIIILQIQVMMADFFWLSCGHIAHSVSQQIERMQSGKLYSYQDIPSYSEHSDYTTSVQQLLKQLIWKLAN